MPAHLRRRALVHVKRKVIPHLTATSHARGVTAKLVQASSHSAAASHCSSSAAQSVASGLQVKSSPLTGMNLCQLEHADIDCRDKSVPA